jgi:hypothetical protein
VRLPSDTLRAPLAGFAAGLLGACSADALVVQIPFEARHRSAVVSLEYGGETRLYAVDAATRDMTPILRSIEGWDEGPIHLLVSYYESSLAELELPGTGALESTDFGRSLARGELLERTVTGEALGEWAPTDRWPEVLAAFRYGDECRTLGARWRMPMPAEVVRWAGLISRPDGSALFVARTAAERPLFYRIDRDGLTRIDSTFDRRATHAFLGNDGRIWMMGGDFPGGPALYVGDPATGFALTTQWTDAPAYPHWSQMASDGVVYSIASSGQLVRIEDGDWTVVHTFPLEVFGNQAALSIAAPGDVFIIDPDGFGVRHLRDGAVTTEATEIDADFANESDRLLSIEHIAGLGTFAGSDGGTILERGDDARWRVIQTPLLIGREIYDILPFNGGAMFAGFYGIVDQFYRRTGFCENTRFRYGNDLQIELMAPIEGGFAVIGQQVVTPEMKLGFVATFDLP